MTPWVRRLLIANVMVFFATQLMPQLVIPLAFRPVLLFREPWTIVTYMFVHGGLWHIAFNMISLFFFGPRVEERLGSQRFLALYLVSGLSGALVSFITPLTPIIGASAAVFGVQLAFARYWPRVQILIWGVLPIEARWLVVIMTVLSLRGGISGGGNIAHWAHLGGYAGAALFLFIMERTSSARKFKARATVPGPAAQRTERESTSMSRWSRIRGEDLHEVNRTELERIRAKIDGSGVGSLTEGDREFLERFSART